MKTVAKGILFAALAMIPFLSSAADGPDSTGMPGDHFDLPGAMELFKKSSSPEQFEKALNTQSNHVNNLDLNGDKKIDYVKVVDRVNGKSHAIILRVNVSEKESQDVAAILIEQTGDKTAQLQIVGNKDLYGEEVVMELYDETEDKKTTGPSPMMAPVHIVIVNVWSWPCVQYIYDPYYVVYVSPWYWGYYPSWWYPWQPYYWHVYYSYVYHYHNYMYHYVPDCTLNTAQNIYITHRTSSPTVIKRYEVQRANYVAGKRGNDDGPAGKKATGRTSDPKVAPRQPGKTTDKPVARPDQPEKKEQQPVARPRNPRNESKEPVRREPQPAQRQNQPERVNPPARPPQQRVNPPARQPQRVSPQQRAPQRVSPPARQSAPQRMGNPGGIRR